LACLANPIADHPGNARLRLPRIRTEPDSPWAAIRKAVPERRLHREDATGSRIDKHKFALIVPAHPLLLRIGIRYGQLTEVLQRVDNA
jgi:hypothetical protein